MKNLRQSTLEKRYFKKDKDGNIVENWGDLCNRVAKALSYNDEEYNQFYNVMHKCYFLPNSPTLMSAGMGNKFSLSACFVVEVEDSMESIFEAVKQSALISKMGGGCGYNFSKIRPKNSAVNSTQGIASGPLSFISVFDSATDTVKQGSKRRGANMSILRIDHPDVMEFIDAKLEQGKFTNFNFSIAITDKFMDAVTYDEYWYFTFIDQFVDKNIKAREIWDKICHNAWKNGEPGVVFLDTINKDNKLINVCGPIEAMNPCSEQPLYPQECCCLASINLSEIWQYPEEFKDHLKNWYHIKPVTNFPDALEYINFDFLKELVEIGVVMLDNIIDKQSYPNEKFEQFHKANRKIGLGVMGWADLLIKLGIKYGSDLSIELAKEIMNFINTEANVISTQLGKKRGIPENCKKAGISRRNATVTTIAPTGTLSILAKCSSGIEPVFNFEIEHNRMDEKYTTYHPLYQEWYSDAAVKNLHSKIPNYFITAAQVTVQEHIKMQAAFQEYTENAISKTINMSSDVTVDEVMEAYELAYELRCKGVTIYRDGSRDDQVLSCKDSNTDNCEYDDKIKEVKLPEIIEAKRIKVNTPEGPIFINISHINNKPYEIFIHHPANTNYAETYESLARLISTCLRNRVSLDEVVDQLSKSHKKYGSISSINNALLKAFKNFIGTDTVVEKCPDCGDNLRMEEGCKNCHSCGYSGCS